MPELKLFRQTIFYLKERKLIEYTEYKIIELIIN